MAHNFEFRIEKCEVCGTFYGYEEQYLELAAQTHLVEAKLCVQRSTQLGGVRRKTQHIFMRFDVHTALRNVHIVRGCAVLRCRCILCGSI